MTLSATTIAKLNKSNKAMQEGAIGTLLGTLEGQGQTADTISALVATITNHQHIVSGDEATAHEAVVLDRTESGYAVSTYIVQVYRSDVLMPNIKVDCTGFTLVLKDNSTDYAVTEGDLVNVIAF